MFTIADARKYARTAFSQSEVLNTGGHTSFLLDTDVLLQHLLGKPRSWLFTHETDDISIYYEAFVSAVKQRTTGMPIAYITGVKEFFGLPFTVTPDVLIPKPDTELLVERSIAIIEHKLRITDRPLCILDPCTGSGCVFISILHGIFSACHKYTNRLFYAVSDISPAALAIAKKNAETLLPLHKKNLIFIQGDMRNLPVLQEKLPSEYRHFDIITANPPYVPSHIAHTILEDGRSEPILALDGGANGLDFIAHLANNALSLLKEDGILLSEADTANAHCAARIFTEQGLSHVTVHKDLAGQNRLVEGVKTLAHAHSRIGKD